MALRVGAVALLALSGSAQARDGAGGGAPGGPDTSGLRIERSGYQGGVNFIAPKTPGDAIKVDAPAGRSRLAPLAFLDQYGGLFGIADPVAELTVDKVEADTLGHVHTTYRQVFKGVPVFSGALKVHQNAKGEVIASNGRFYPIKPTTIVTPTLDADAGALAAAKVLWDAPKAAIEEQKLMIVDPGWYGDPAAGARLAWYVVLSDGDAVREAMFIDAHTGELLDRWTLIEELLNRSILDGLGGATVPTTPARVEGGAAVADAEVNKAYDYAGDYYRYLQRAFGRDSINNAGFTLTVLVNSTGLSCPNANWNGIRGTFCTGIVTDEIISHELTHGLTQYTAGLIYQNQSGQLNESFSDVVGETVDQFNGNASAIGAPGGLAWPLPPAVGPGVDTPNNARSVCSPRPGHPDGVRWLLGEDAAAFGGAIRDMWDPTCRNHPDRANSPLQTCSATDSGGVHSGSGVPNHAYALLVDGGTFNGHTVTGIGLIKAGAVWYRALTTYLTPASDFKDAYVALNQAATDLIGTAPNDPRTGLPSASPITAADVQQVNQALLAVEMDTDGLCGQTSNVLDDTTIPLECPNRVVLFSDDFESATLGWQVANSAPPTPYNWVVSSSPLPFGRAGKAAYCEDRWVGDCNASDESGSHSMNSQTIEVPAGATHPYLAFTHFIGSEAAFDGGLVEIAVNGGAYAPIPRSAIEFNPYNNKLRSAALGNTDPLAGQETWSGIGGAWGRTIIDLSGLGVTGGSFRIRFTLGKDGCTGGEGWYVDDLVVYDCPDCDANSTADVRQFRYRSSTPLSGPIGSGSNVQFTLTNVPDAASGVTLEFLANADLSAATEFLDVRVNGSSVGSAYVVGGVDCGATPTRASLLITAAAWNSAVNLSPSGSTGVIDLIGTADMNAAACNGSFVGINVRYDLAAADSNGNFILDTCEPRPCPADFNQSGGITVQDIFDFLAAYFAQLPSADFNHAGGITVQDIFDFLAAYFTGCP
jgi:Zn-dependent metalloprotease